VQAALDHSLPIKRTEAGLKTLTLWGKLSTLNGKVRACPASYVISSITGGIFVFFGWGESVDGCSV